MFHPGRCGSTVLGNLLNQHPSIEWDGEIYEPQGRFYRYAVAIPVERPCLVCHDAADTLPDSVRAQLAIDYPFDKATGYKVGEVYGVVAIKRPF